MTRRRRFLTDYVRPTIPVVPLLVLGFLLHSVHVFVYRGSGLEVDIPIDLPKEGHDPDWIEFHENRTSLVVTVTAGPDGRVADTTLEETNRPSMPKRVTGGLRFYRRELVAYLAARPGPPPRMKLEIGDSFTHQGFVDVLTAARQVGFNEVLAYPADPWKR